MTIDDIALTLLPGLGIKGVAWLLSVFGSAGAVYAAGERRLIEEAELKLEYARGIAGKVSHQKAGKELKYLEKNSIIAIASTDPEYPQLLLECPDYPHVLYLQGDIEALNGRLVSIVGTRTATPYGQRMCGVLAGRMAELGGDTVIVSGLAYGIDAAAHRAALEYGLRTVAVVANPLPEVTPSQHRALADEIITGGGAVITELHSQTKQNGTYFIPRNRIIAGMSAGTVVAESPYRGGSLSTAELAESYGRTLMAVPGRAGDRCSEGANLLIKRQRAAMITSGDDIFHELGWDISQEGRVPVAPLHNPLLNPAEKKVLDCFGEGESLGLDTVALRTGMRIGELTGLLLSLEIGSLVRALPGKIYEKI